MILKDTVYKPVNRKTGILLPIRAQQVQSSGGSDQDVSRRNLPDTDDPGRQTGGRVVRTIMTQDPSRYQVVDIDSLVEGSDPQVAAAFQHQPLDISGDGLSVPLQ